MLLDKVCHQPHYCILHAECNMEFGDLPTVRNFAMNSPFPPADAIKRTSLRDSVYETILAAVLGGKWKPGTELNAVALAQQLGVSRTPVTEALRRLGQDGLLVEMMNRRPRVAHFSAEDVTEIYEMRALLEGKATELAATRLGPSELDALQHQAQLLEDDQERVDWSEQALQYDLFFHEVIARGCGNRRLEEDISRYRRLVRAFCRMSGSEQNVRAAFREHLDVLSALHRRDSQTAGRAMRDHIVRRRDAVLGELYPPS